MESEIKKLDLEWASLTITNNFLFQKVMRNPDLCKRLLEKILQVEIEKIVYLDNEKALKSNYSSKGVRLDVYVKDGKGTIYNVEMQPVKLPLPELARRFRYYQCSIDQDCFDRGQDYIDLQDSFVIFICTYDLFGANKPIYTFRNRCDEDKDIVLGDGCTKVFLNSKGDKTGLDADVAAFLDYVDGKAPEGFAKEFDDALNDAKARDDWRHEYMNYEMEMRIQKRKVREECEMEMRVQKRKAREEEKENTAIELLKAGSAIDFVAQITKLSVEHIKKLGTVHGLL